MAEEKPLFSLPAHESGLGIHNTINSAQLAFSTWRKIPAAIKGDEKFSVEGYVESLLTLQSRENKEKEMRPEEKLETAFLSVDATKKRAIMRAID